MMNTRIASNRLRLRSVQTLATSVAALFFALVTVIVLTAGPLAPTAWADELPCQTGKAHGTYEHPITKEVADSAGPVGQAMGQLMIGKVIDETCMLQTGSSSSWLNTRWHLTNSISDIKLQVQEPGESTWADAEYELTSEGDDTFDMRVPVLSDGTIIKAQAHIQPIGRDVTFFIYGDEWTDGNTGNFAALDESADEGASDDAAADESDSTEDAAASTTNGEEAEQSGNGNGNGETAAPENQVVTDPTKLEADMGFWITLFLTVFCAMFFGVLLAHLVLHWLGIKPIKLLERRQSKQQKSADPETEADAVVKTESAPESAPEPKPEPKPKPKPEAEPEA